ncbi:MAG: sodium:solute symporter family protein [Armatimonadota bacterium]|nr:sodium:solute symporter family protein [Armatimonadota bacterium]
MTGIDYTVVAVYLAFVAAVGFIVRTRIKGLEDYFAGGHNVPWWLAAVSHHISGYSAFAFVGYASVAYTVGFNVWTLFAVPCFVAMTVGAFVWAPRWSRLRVMTPVEYLERRFNRTVHQLIAWSGIAVKFVDEGMKLYSLGIVVAACAGLPLSATIIGCGVVAILYILVGGLWAELLTDFSQFIVQFITTIILAVVVLGAIGGWDSIWAQLPEGHWGLFSEKYDLAYILVFMVVITLSYNGGTWGLAQRFYSIGAPNDAKKAALLSASLYLVYPIILYIPVWAARPLIGEVANPEETYALMAVEYLPPLAPGLVGLFVASMFAATMSMVDSDLNALAAVFTKDIYQRTFDTDASEKTLLKVGLLATGVLGAITIATGLLAPSFGGAFEGMMDWYAAVLGPVSVPLLFGMLNRRTSWRGALTAWGAGFATFVLLKYGLPHVLPQFAVEGTHWTIYTGGELLVTFGVFLLEGYLTKLSPDEAERADALIQQVGSRQQPQA